MARPLRPQVEDGIYHVTSRGNRSLEIYVDSTDRTYFLQLLTRNAERFGWLIHAYCQMTNHYHLLVETPLANISVAMQRLNSMYTGWFNWRYDFEGHVFQGRFHSELGRDRCALHRVLPVHRSQAGASRHLCRSGGI